MDEQRDEPERRKPQLRNQAEVLLAAKPGAAAERPVEELLHELQVHQIELEMQNESLRQAQVALEESRDRYADLYEFAPIGYLCLSPSGQITASNLTCSALLGLERARLRGRRFASLVAREDRDRWQACFGRLLRQSDREQCELALLRADDSQFQARLDCLCMRSEGSAANIRVTLIDITRAAKAERELAEQEALLRTIAENSPDAIFVLDRSHRLRYVNPVALGLAQEVRQRPDLALGDLVGLEAVGVFGDTALARSFMRLDEQAMASGQVITTEDEVRAGGEPRTRLTVRTPLRDGLEQVVGLVGIARDITDHRRAEAEQLDILKRQRDALVREVHHRIKNNLQGVIGLLRQDIADHPLTQPAIETAIAQINTIAVVHGLQSRMPQNELRLRELLHEVCGAAATLAMLPQRPTVDDALAGDVWLDNNASVSVALILNELIHNALKHCQPADGAGVRIGLSGDSQHATVRISNPGGPLPAKFDLASGTGCGTGLNLIRTLLPRRGATLKIFVHDGCVETEFVLGPPLTTESELAASPLDNASKP